MKRILTLIMAAALLLPIPYANADPVGERDPGAAWTATHQWAREHGYEFPIYGSTSVDLSPISDYLAILNENGIYFTLPDLSISDHGEYVWITSYFSDYWLLYKYYNDGSGYSMLFQVPAVYRPKDEALALLMVSVLDIDREKAESLMRSLRYNVIDKYAQIRSDEYILEYMEDTDSLALTVTKITK